MSILSPIAISGDPGSGKSSVAEQISAALGWRLVSTGAKHRSIARSQQVDTLELNRRAASPESNIDQTVDDVLRELAASEELVVVDSRMAWWFIPGAISIHLTVLPQVAGDRAFLRGRDLGSDERYGSAEIATLALQERARIEQERFANLYDVNIARLRNYNCVIDTTGFSVDHVANLIIQFAAESTAGTRPEKLYLSPNCMYPTQRARDMTDRRSIAVQENVPVSIGFSYPYFFIVDGHHRVRASVERGDLEVEPIFLGEGDEEIVGSITANAYFRDSVSVSAIHDWDVETGIALPQILKA